MVNDEIGWCESHVRVILGLTGNGEFHDSIGMIIHRKFFGNEQSDISS